MKKRNYLEGWPKQDIETLIEGYPYRGSSVREDFIIERTVCETRKAASALGVKFIIIPWTLEEDIIVCRGYLNNASVKDIINELISKGYPRRTRNNIYKKSYNFRFLDTGEGYYKYSEQSEKAYKIVSKNPHPYTKPLKKSKGGDQ